MSEYVDGGSSNGVERTEKEESVGGTEPEDRLVPGDHDEGLEKSIEIQTQALVRNMDTS